MAFKQVLQYLQKCDNNKKKVCNIGRHTCRKEYSVNNSQNPSAVQSKEWIMNSLIALMQVKNYNEITVSEIAEKSGIVRRTFYRNFDSKEDVLDSYLNMLFQKFSDMLSSYAEIDCDLSLRILFNICKENSSVFKALENSNMLGLMLKKWNVVLPVLHNLLLDKIKQFPKTKSEESLEYLLTFNAGGIFNLVVKWIEEGMILTPDELADIVYVFAFGSLMSSQ